MNLFNLFRKRGNYPLGRDVMRSAVVRPGDAELLKEATACNRRMINHYGRSYEAAYTSQYNLDHQPTIGSANAEILTSLYIVRGRVRTLDKDDATTKGMIRTFKNEVCGDDPFRLQMKVGHRDGSGTFVLEDEVNQKICEAWHDFIQPENLTVRGDMGWMEFCQLLEASTVRDGNIVVRHHNDFPHNKFGYAVETIDSDRLQESFMGKAEETGNSIRFSIERDKYNRAVAYWILSRHPGDLFQYNGPTANTWRERVPAENITLVTNLRDRAEQDIGFPELCAISAPLHRNRQFDIAHVTAAIWSAAKPMFLIKDIPTGIQYSGDPSIQYNQITGSGDGAGTVAAGGDGKGGGVNKLKSVMPGTVEVLDWGLKPVFHDPKFPIEAATSFKKDNLHCVSVGSGLSYQSVSGNYEGMSFSSARMAAIPERSNFKVRQNHLKLALREIFKRWLHAWLGTIDCELPMSRYDEFLKAAHFHGKRWEYINPTDDAKADIMLIEARLKSPQEVLSESESGRDLEHVYSDLAQAQKMADDHGLKNEIDVTSPQLPKGTPGQAAGEPPAEK